MTELDSSFNCSYGVLKDTEWHEVLERFPDATIFQTVPFGLASRGKLSVRHLVLHRGSRVVAAAQASVFSIPFLGKGIAHIRWGPVWRTREGVSDIETSRQMVRALKNEFVMKRGMLLRVFPMLSSEDADRFIPLFAEEGYVRAQDGAIDRTMVLDLSRTIDELRKGLDQKWRNQLKRAEGNGLTIVENCEDSLLDGFSVLYNEMLSRKGIDEPGDIRRFREIQPKLPAKWKMRVFLCLDKGQPSAGAICSALGKRGLYLFGATGNRGLENKASYLVHWKVIQWLKESGCTEYDLHGVNRESNPGVYTFKAGLCSRNGKEIEMLGGFDAFRRPVDRWMLRMAGLASAAYKRLRKRYEAIHR